MSGPRPRPSVQPLTANELDGDVVDRFRLVARLCATELAVSAPRGTLTYAELDHWSDDLARRLLDRAHESAETGEARFSDRASRAAADRQGAPDRPVAILLGHDPAAVVAMIGVLKAGRPFLALDSSLPPDRLARVLELADADLCVCGGPALGYTVGGTGADLGGTDVAPDPARLLPPWVERIEIGVPPPGRPEPTSLAPFAVSAATQAPGPADGRAGGRAAGAQTTPGGLAGPSGRAPRRSGGDLAMLIFTSGSTGTPKGVMWNHRTLLRHVSVFQDGVGLTADDRLGLLLPYSFISGASMVFRSLLTGATLSMYDPRAHGMRALPAWLRAERPTVLWFTPSLLRAVAGALDPGEVLGSVRCVTTASDALHARDARLLRQHLPYEAAVVVSYGSSEAGLVTLGITGPGEPLPDGVLPAGVPQPGTAVRLLRDDGTEAAPGEAGEIVVAGRYLTGGYWRDPEQTAARYGVGDDGVPYYRSGDAGRFGPDGLLRITGRLDGMVKVRGYLVEPIEIEAALLSSEEVSDAVVATDASTEPARLVAYVVPSPSSRPSPASIRRLLRARLPAYMVPSTVMILPALPRTERGKVDRKALPPAPPALAGDLPRNDWEEAVAGLWARVLDLDSVGIHDDFLELGGDSLAAQDVVSRLFEELGVRLPTSVLAQAPTVAELAAVAAQASSSASRITPRHPDVIPLRTGGTGVPLFCFSGAGGLAIAMLALAANFDGERPVYGLQAHGLERRGLPDWTVEAAARRHVRALRLLAPRGPYLLVGHSFGGLVALETAHLLRAAGEHVGLLALIDSTPPGGLRVSMTGSIVSSQHSGGPEQAGGSYSWDKPPRAWPPRPAPPADGQTSAARRALDRAPRFLSDRAPRFLTDRADLLRTMAHRASRIGLVPLTGLVQFPDDRQFRTFYDQGRLVSMTYRPAPWTGRALLWQAAAKVSNPELRPVSGPWAQLLTGRDAVARTVVGNHDSILREPLVGALADDIRARIAHLDQDVSGGS
ncbi:non-ribosomal peptide synthetase [Frankia nepalensis]|uniref:AMP-binding protein n=1 Tax=Frankia nepalensis TaxID=1836974 RepID=A0A937RQC5_9ACTN|nr:AMP-binding protein [Frankia nepalensis]MBL7500825.1 AMP-binding protein [Frankia nepalensis]MBL7515381.1 AMP-binding protein [Frankia nepalensis]MBL7631449.1 AMP-binding protein [Frankia nepalensis]